MVLGEPKQLSEVDIKRTRGGYCVYSSRSVPVFSLDFRVFVLFYLSFFFCFLCMRHADYHLKPEGKKKE